MEQIEIEISPVHFSILSEYVTVPILFEMNSIAQFNFEVTPPSFRIEQINKTFKDYDILPDNSPYSWAIHFDQSNWVYCMARDNGRCIGCATIATRTPSVKMLEGRNDLAVLWDIRVHPDHRGKMIGSRLLLAAEKWARKHHCVEMKIETQNNNVDAMQFYVKNGYSLKHVVPNAYPEFPAEIQLLYYKNLGI